MAQINGCIAVPPKQPFHFFDLPSKPMVLRGHTAKANHYTGELRDIVYSLLIRDIAVPGLDKFFGSPVGIGITHFAYPQPRLVNRQLASEYQEQMDRTQKSQLTVCVTVAKLPRTFRKDALYSPYECNTPRDLSKIKYMRLKIESDVFLEKRRRPFGKFQEK
jgi:hypothetical protein